MIEKRYQVFVSSTYTDLIEERNEVMQALLELDCIPAGMELFPAANDEQWGWIKKVVSESDYYVVILAGRYGSIHKPTGMSYTEREYLYAVEIGKPVIGFLHENPGKIPAERVEEDSHRRHQLNAFRDLIENTRLCKYWSNPADLGAKVSRSLTQLIRQCPAVGWVRADKLPSEDILREALDLRRTNETLKDEIALLSKTRPPEMEILACGKEKVKLEFTFTRKRKSKPHSWVKIGDEESSLELSWDELLVVIAPCGDNWDYFFRYNLNRKIECTAEKELACKFPEERLVDFCITEDSLAIVLTQLQELKLLRIKGQEAGYDRCQIKVTSFGQQYITDLFSVPKGENRAPISIKTMKDDKRYD